MVQEDNGRHQEERKELVRNQKGRAVRGKDRLETFSPVTCIKHKACLKKDY
jgi:hypothetical protein